MEIGNFKIGSKTFIIAELSANHGHDKSIAIETVKAAKKAGADAIKLQTYRPDTITIDCDNKYFQINDGTQWDGRTLYDLYEEAHLPWEWHEELFKVARDEGLTCFSSPFDKTAVDFLEELNTPAYKIASFEIQDIPLIEYAASKGKPIIMSTGIAMKEDIKLAIDTCRNVGNEEIILLKCTSSYPAPIELANLKTMVDMKERFGVEVGLSDHTLGNTVPVVATSLGAKVIEKHFILDKSIGGPDADFSLDLKEFSSMVKAVRDAEMALGEVTYELSEKVEKNKKFARSLFAVKDIKKGEKFTEKNVRSIRPGYGLHPKYLKEILKNEASNDIERGIPITNQLIARN
ncbi:pseudaminic acid synthase [Gracilimonas tropica]|uniref:pseudaminic acid synthase n=1 Tax=Gracilimonas tropica TaxID=454600 RepID=UPI000363B1C5|nr:pseudaminic acid synthase [Gracilimonas tropica]